MQEHYIFAICLSSVPSLFAGASDRPSLCRGARGARGLLTTERHDHLVGCLYASAMGDAPWRDTIEQLASAFGTHSSLVHVLDSAGQVMDFETYPFSREFAAKFYASELYRSDPRIQRFELVRPGSVYFDHALFDIEEMNRN